MIPQPSRLIESKKFLILEGAEQELVNEGMYRNALCLYLRTKLPLAGIDVPFFCNDDSG